MGDSRYVVEPNVKEGKGGLRDLHTLFWIGKYAYRLRSVAELVEVGLFSQAEIAPVPAAPSASCGRCAATSTSIAGRAEDRLTFDYQREIASADELCRPARQDRRSSASCTTISCTRRRSAT